jgi:hypothetical protein
MKVTWELDTNNPQDLSVLHAMHAVIHFDVPEVPGETKPKLKSVEEPAAEAKAPAAETKKAPPKRKKRQPKEKTKDQLMALSLDEMIAYLKARTKFSLLDCRILSKHYNDKFGEVQSVLDILHGLDANNFDDLKKIPEFLVATIKMIEAKEAETEEEEETTTDDLLGV